MSFKIPSDLQEFVDEQLKLGCYDSESEIVADGLRLLKAVREETVEGIKAGLEDAAAGRVQPLSEAFAELRREIGVD
jgi:putative addiction module CopG family antidote